MSIIPMPERAADLQRELTDCREALAHATQRLIEQEKLAALGALVPGLAHDINTPIGIAVTAASSAADCAQTLNRKLAADKVSRHEIQSLADQIRSASTLVTDNLLRATELIGSFKTMAVDQASADDAQLDLAQYLRSIVRVHQPALRAARAQARVDAPEQLRTRLPSGKFSQIVSNLIMNALTHAFEGVEDRRIELSLWTQSGLIFMRCADNGRGADAEVRARMFEPLFTTRRGRGGSGLGLHIVDTLSRQMGGHVRLEERGGPGLSFLVELPLRP
jgi:signal transduction histidine kinase